MDYSFIMEEEENYKVTAEEVDEIEKRLNLSFPAVLRNYYIEHNGALIDTCYPVFNDGYERDIETIMALKYTSAPVEYTRELFIKNNFFNPKLVPFAENGGGDCYCWHLDTGKVYMVYADDVENPDYLCESAEDFFAVLCDCEREEY